MPGSVDGTFNCNKIVANQVGFADNAVPSQSVVHRFTVGHSIASNVTVTAFTIPVHHFRRSGKIRSVNVVPYTVPTGGDLAYTVDVKLGNQATPEATVLTGVITINSSDATRQVNAGTLTSTTINCAAGDFIAVTFAVTGSTGTQGLGCVVSVVVDEDAE
jgi:hypothetical protein